MRTASLVALCLAASAAPLLSQTSECAAFASSTRRVCSAAVDATRAFHPIAGILVSGGNPTIGSAGTLGGIGHATFALRANAVELVVPDLNYDGGAAAVPADDMFWVR